MLVAPMHAPHSLHAPHAQPESHVRLRVCVPPHAQPWLSISTCPGMHAPPPVHAPSSLHGPHVQPARQEPGRVAVPVHLHACGSISVAPSAHSPSPSHAPSSIHIPPEQRWWTTPHIPHDTSRVSLPVHVQLVGASHGSHRPSLQRSTPLAHALLQTR